MTAQRPRVSKRISLETINGLPLRYYEGPIHLLQDYDAARVAVQKLQTVSLVGFDTESRPAFHVGQHYRPALVQIATADEVYLFQLHLIGHIRPLLPLFESESVKKVCLGVGEDLRRLKEFQDFPAANFEELATVAGHVGIEDRSLRKLCANLLGFRISKREQTSNWGRDCLSDRQLRYAATDAWVSREIYERAQLLLVEGYDLV